MPLTLAQSVATSRALQERLASVATEKRAELEQKAAMVDFATFGMFKEALSMGPGLEAARRGLGWGVGLGVPALGVGHLLARDARHQGEKTIDHARNQALLTALGVGGIKGVGDAVNAALRPSAPRAPEMNTPAATPAAQNNLVVQQPQRYEQAMAQPGLGISELAALRGYPGLEQFQEGGDLSDLDEFNNFKTSSDEVLQKLAAVVLLDNVLEQQLSKLAGAEWADTCECLFLNRSHGTSLLRELY